MADAGEGPADGTAVCVNGDGTGLPFPDATFDRIICSEVMEHIPDDTLAMAEVRRVLKPGANSVTVPTWFPGESAWALNEEYHAPFVAGGHVRIFTEPELRRKCAKQGSCPASRTTLTRCIRPTGGSSAPSDRPTSITPWCRPTTGSWCGTSRRPLKVTRLTERLLNPVLGKTLVVYARKPDEWEVADDV